MPQKPLKVVVDINPKPKTETETPQFSIAFRKDSDFDFDKNGYVVYPLLKEAIGVRAVRKATSQFLMSLANSYVTEQKLKEAFDKAKTEETAEETTTEETTAES